MSLLGKPCHDCGAPLVSLSSLSRRICSGCKREQAWELEEGQKPLINTSRGDRKNGN